MTFPQNKRYHHHSADQIADLPEASVATVQMLGPFIVAFNTPNLLDDLVELAALPAGTAVWGVRVVCTQDWNGLRLAVKMTTPSTNEMIWLSAGSHAGPPASPIWATDSGDDSAYETASQGGFIAALSGRCGVYATASRDGGWDPSTTGQAKVYILASVV